MTALVLNLKPFVVTDQEFVELVKSNPELCFERMMTGKVIVMPPTASDTDIRSGGVFGLVWRWNERTQLGFAFDSSAGFRLLNGATRSPDAAWIPRARCEALPPPLRRGFLHRSALILLLKLSPLPTNWKLCRRNYANICSTALAWAG